MTAFSSVRSFLMEPPITRSGRTDLTLKVSLFIIFGVYTTVHFPGVLTGDSLYMLAQARGAEEWSNWHPAFGVVIWAIGLGIGLGSNGLWLAQVSIFILAAFRLSRRLPNRIVASGALIILTLNPGVFTNMGALWKDNWTLALLLLGVSFLVDLIFEGNRASILLMLSSLLAASLFRVDYAPVAITFASIGILIYVRKQNTEKKIIKKVVVLTSIFALAGLGFGSVVSSFPTKKLDSWAVALIWDIAGINSKASKDLNQNYNCKTSDPLVFTSDQYVPFKLPQAPDSPGVRTGTQIIEIWVTKVTQNPGAYLEHRACVAGAFLGIGPSDPHYPYPIPSFQAINSDTFSGAGENLPRSTQSISAYGFFDLIASGSLFRYWFYLSLSLVTLLWAHSVITSLHKDVLALLIGLYLSIMFTVARVIVLPAADFRYGLWVVVATLLIPFLLCIRPHAQMPRAPHLPEEPHSNSGGVQSPTKANDEKSKI